MKTKSILTTAALTSAITLTATIAQLLGAHITTSPGHTVAVGAVLTAIATALHAATQTGATAVKNARKPSVAVQPAKHAPTMVLWVWEEALDIKALDEFVKAGITHLAVKIHDGASQTRQYVLWSDWQAYCKSRRLTLGAWGYVREATDGVNVGNLLRGKLPAFYVADVEVPFSQSDVSYFTDAVRSSAGSIPLWLSSFGRIDLHPEISWTQFAREGYHFMPQAYQCESLDLTPIECLQACRSLFPHAQPTLGLYAGARGRISAEGLAASIRHLDLPMGVGIYRAGTATADEVAAIRVAV